MPQSQENRDSAPSEQAENPVSAPVPTILQVVPALERGGVERGAVDMAAAIVKGGGRAIVASSGGAMEGELRRAGATHVSLPLKEKNPSVIWANIERLKGVIEEHGAHLVHARSRAPAWSALYAAERAGVPFMTTFHSAYGHGNPLKRLYNSVMVRGTRVIAVSDFIGRHIKATYRIDPSKIRVIPRGIDPDRYDPDKVSVERMIDLAKSWGLPEDRRTILLPGRLTRLKGHTTLIKALVDLPDDVFAVCLGADQANGRYRAELENLADKLGVRSKFAIVEACRDMPAAYSLAHVVVNPSTVPEGFARTVAEAQCIGRPVVVTNLGAPTELILEGETGWSVPPGDPGALAKAIGEIIALKNDTRKFLATKARLNMTSHFTLAAMTDATLDVYEEVLRESGFPG